MRLAPSHHRPDRRSAGRRARRGGRPGFGRTQRCPRGRRESHGPDPEHRGRDAPRDRSGDEPGESQDEANDNADARRDRSTHLWGEVSSRPGRPQRQPDEWQRHRRAYRRTDRHSHSGGRPTLPVRQHPPDRRDAAQNPHREDEHQPRLGRLPGEALGGRRPPVEDDQTLQNAQLGRREHHSGAERPPYQRRPCARCHPTKGTSSTHVSGSDVPETPSDHRCRSSWATGSF